MHGNKWMLKFLLIAMMAHWHLCSKVLIITHVYNRPEFLNWQCLCFQKFLEDEYELVVFNDAPPGAMHEAIVAMCDQWRIRSIPVPQELHDYLAEDLFWQTGTAVGTRRHADGIQYSLDLLGYDHEGAVAIVDSDLFLVKPFSIEKSLEDFDIVAITRSSFHWEGNIIHLWPGLTLLAMDRLPNKRTLSFNYGRVNGHLVDTGGHTYHYLQNHQDVRLFSLGYFPLGNWHTDVSDLPVKERLKIYKRLNFEKTEIDWLLKYPAAATSMEFYYFNHFIHYGSGRFANEVRSMALAEYMEKLLDDHL